MRVTPLSTDQANSCLSQPIEKEDETELLEELFSRVELNSEKDLEQRCRVVFPLFEPLVINSKQTLGRALFGEAFGNLMYRLGRNKLFRFVSTIAWLIGVLCCTLALSFPERLDIFVLSLLAVQGNMVFILLLDSARLKLLLTQFDVQFLLLNIFLFLFAFMKFVGDLRRITVIICTFPSFVALVCMDAQMAKAESGPVRAFKIFLSIYGGANLVTSFFGTFSGHIKPLGSETGDSALFFMFKTRDVLYGTGLNCLSNVVGLVVTFTARKNNLIKARVASGFLPVPLAKALVDYSTAIAETRQCSAKEKRKNPNVQRVVIPTMKPFTIDARHTVSRFLCNRSLSNFLYRLVASKVTGFGILGNLFAAGLLGFSVAVGQSRQTYILLLTLLTIPASVIDLLLVNTKLLPWVFRRFKTYYLLANYMAFAYFGGYFLPAAWAKLSLCVLCVFCFFGTVLNDVVPSSLRSGLALLFLPMQVALFVYLTCGLLFDLFPMFNDQVDEHVLFLRYPLSLRRRLVPAALNILSFCLAQYQQKLFHPEQYSSISSHTTMAYVTPDEFCYYKLLHSPAELEAAFLKWLARKQSKAIPHQ